MAKKRVGAKRQAGRERVGRGGGEQVTLLRQAQERNGKVQKQVPHRVFDSVRNDSDGLGRGVRNDSDGLGRGVRNDSDGVGRGVRNDSDVVGRGVRNDSDVVGRGARNDSDIRKERRNSKANHPGCPRASMRIGHPSRKRLGEASEAAFVARGIGFNFPVAKLWGESDPCDTLVGFGWIHWRVQVKCAQSCVDGKYKVKGGGLNHNYTKEDIDFLAAHIVPENIWYIIPVEAFQGRRMLQFRPDGRGERKYEKYREAWCLLACAPAERGRGDIPGECRCRELPVRCAVCPRR